MKKRKTTAIAAAGAILVMTMLLGTFAWESISQIATNEVTENLNPGGRLHDDFNGKNKDVYVENFTDPEDGGVTIYARIRLDEYLEIGSGAGQPDGTEGKEANSVVETAQLGDPNTWTTHNPYGTDEVFHDYFTWEEGGSTTYMPTFNMNKDSLAADINGTLSGGTTGVRYGDYVDYSDPANATKTGDEVWDADDDTDDEENPVEGTDINTTTGVSHTVNTTLNATVITMSEWKTMGCPTGEYWVYDTDGWAYWAQGIEPGTATGLLLSGIERKPSLVDDYYYAINVVGQFVTSGEWGNNGDGTGYFAEGEPATNDALYLLAVASGAETTVKITTRQNVTYLDPGKTLQFTGRVMLGESVLDGQKVNWSVQDQKSADTTINSSGLLTVGADETSNTIIIIAESVDDPTIKGMYVLHINVPDSYGVYVMPEDELDYVVLGRERKFEAEVTKNGVVDKSQIVVWSVEGGNASGTAIGANTGVLSVDASETAETLTVTATCSADGTARGSYEIRVIDDVEYIKYVEIGSTETVHIDGYDWYVLAKSVDNYLLWSKENVTNRVFATANSHNWSNSQLRTWLNGTTTGGQFLGQLTTLKELVIPQNITTRTSYNVEDWTNTEDSVFLLSEADVFGTYNNKATTDPRDYTYGTTVLAADLELRTCTAPGYWTRSKASGSNVVIVNAETGARTSKGATATGYGVRPALWVNPDKATE